MMGYDYRMTDKALKATVVAPSGSVTTYGCGDSDRDTGRERRKKVTDAGCVISKVRRNLSKSFSAVLVTHRYSDSVAERLSRPDSLLQGGTALESIGYLGTGMVVSREVHEPGLTQTVSLSGLGRVSGVMWSKAGTAVDQYAYTFTDRGELKEKTNVKNGALSQTYEYNKLGHATSMVEGGVGGTTTPTTTTWQVDTLGNKTGGPYGAQAFVSNEDVGSTYNTAGGAESFTIGDNPVTATYDPWGRLHSLAYSYATYSGEEGPPVWLSQSYVFEYDALGRRIQTTANGVVENVTVDTYYAGDKAIEEFTNSVLREQYVYSLSGDLLLVDVNTDGNNGTGSVGFAGLDERRYILTDGLGNTTAVANASGTVIQRYAYDNEGRLKVYDAAWTATPTAQLQVDVLHGGDRTLQIKKGDNTFGVIYEQGGGSWRDPQAGRLLAPDAAAQAAGRNGYLNEIYTAQMEGGIESGAWVSAPGTLEGFAPVWGSGRQAIHDFSLGRYWEAFGNGGLAVADLVGIGLVAKATVLPVAKTAIREIGERVTSEAMSGVVQRASAYGRGFVGGLSTATVFMPLDGGFDIFRQAHRYGKMAAREAIENGMLREVTARQAGAISGEITRDMAARREFLRSLVKDYRTPSWMKSWLKQGKVPPGYAVDHIKPLSVGGLDTPTNMRLQGGDLHKIHHKFYRPWRKS